MMEEKKYTYIDNVPRSGLATQGLQTIDIARQQYETNLLSGSPRSLRVFINICYRRL